MTDEQTTSDAAAPPARPLRVLHVLAYSEPRLNGYSLRSRYIIHWQRDQDDLEPFVATSPFYPHDVPAGDEVREGVKYYRIAHPVQMSDGTLRERLCRQMTRRKYAQLKARRTSPNQAAPLKRWSPKWIARIPLQIVRRFALQLKRMLRPMAGPFEQKVLLERFERELVRIGREVRADVIHAHSPYRCGIPAMRAAAKLGLPMVYETRGFWEDSGVANGNMVEGDAEYMRWRNHETAVMKGADAVVGICRGITDDIIERGVPADRMFVSYNAADLDAFRPLTDAERAEAEGDPQWRQVRDSLPGVTMGYVGSIRELEGVDDLIRGFAEVAKDRPSCSLLIVGGGADLDKLKALAAEMGVADRAVFPGRVPHDKVRLYYDLIDVFVVSRRRMRVCELVTPLKPLEAMAMGKTLVVSDLKALAEIVDDGQTGLTYAAGAPSSLAEAARRLIDDEPLRARLAEAGLQWVREHRTWNRTLTELYRVYERVGAYPPGKNTDGD